jgi:hypothetical protein
VPAQSGGSGGVASAGTGTTMSGSRALAATGLPGGGAALGVLLTVASAGAAAARRRVPCS